MKFGRFLTCAALSMAIPAIAGTPTTNPPKVNVPFGGQTPSGPLYFGPGTTATVSGKFFNNPNATGGQAIICDGCSGVNVQNSDFDYENEPAIIIRNAGTPANPIPVVVLHNRHKKPVLGVQLINSTAAPSSTITHNGMRGVSPKFQRFIEVGNNSGGEPPLYCTSRGLPASNCILKLWYNHCDGTDPDTGADPVEPAGSVGIMVGNNATIQSGYVETIYNTMMYCGAINKKISGGEANITYYDKYYQTPDVQGSVGNLVVSKDASSLVPATPPSATVNYFVCDDETGHLPCVKDDGSLGNSTYESNVNEQENLSGDENNTVAPE